MIRIGGRNFRTPQESLEWLMTQYNILTQGKVDTSVAFFGRVDDNTQLPTAGTTELAYLVGTQRPYELYVQTQIGDLSWSWLNLGEYPRKGDTGDTGATGQAGQDGKDGQRGQDGRTTTLTYGAIERVYEAPSYDMLLITQKDLFNRVANTGEVFLAVIKLDNRSFVTMQEIIVVGATEYTSKTRSWVETTGLRGVDGTSVQIMSPILSSVTELPNFNTVAVGTAYLVKEGNNPTMIYARFVGGTDWGISQWQGEAGVDGQDGQSGQDGQDGQNGVNGITPNIGANGNWWIGNFDTGVQAGNKKIYMHNIMISVANNTITYNDNAYNNIKPRISFYSTKSTKFTKQELIQYIQKGLQIPAFSRVQVNGVYTGIVTGIWGTNISALLMIIIDTQTGDSFTATALEQDIEINYTSSYDGTMQDEPIEI